MSRSTLGGFGRLALTALAGIAVAAAVMLAGYQLSFKTWHEKIARAERDFDDLELKIREARAAEQMYPQFLEALARLESEREQLRALLPSRPRMSELLDRVRWLGSVYGLRIERLTPSDEPPEDREFYRQTPVRVTVRGSDGGLASFCDALQRGAWLLAIDELVLHPLDDGRPPAEVQAEMIILAFLEAPAPVSEEERLPARDPWLEPIAEPIKVRPAGGT